jgi:hypothetical protein
MPHQLLIYLLVGQLLDDPYKLFKHSYPKNQTSDSNPCFLLCVLRETFGNSFLKTIQDILDYVLNIYLFN